ncbi:MAG: hypothetical protein V4590_04650 [Bacteroidota bacterium]
MGSRNKAKVASIKTESELTMNFFWFSLVISFLPILFRIASYYGFKHHGLIEIFDVKDVIFGSIGLTLGNFNLIVYFKDEEQRKNMTRTSYIVAGFFCVCVGVVFADDASGNSLLEGVFCRTILLIAILYSLYVSFSANKTAIDLKN